jgi:GTP-binding protein
MPATRRMFVAAWLAIAAAFLLTSNDVGNFASAFGIARSRNRGRGVLFSTESETSLSSDAGDFSFFDEASIYVRAGSGGQGSSTYKKAKKGQNGIPDGGSGGIGGNVVLKLDPSLNTLAGLSRRALRPNAFGGGGAAASSKRMGHNAKQGETVDESNFVARERLLSFRASDGKPGGRMYDNGRGGEDCEVLVPPGTVVKLEVLRDINITAETSGDEEIDTDNGDNDDESSDDSESEGEYDLVEIGTVSYENPTLIVARGGRGGEGTATLKGKKKGATRRGPEGGERCRLRLTLKIVADIALVGVPNAGKSTFLAAVTRAKPRIADYPFTTVVPNLGTWIPPQDKRENTDPSHYSNYSKDGAKKSSEPNRAAGSTGLVLCDVPGLIAGASEGVGLGHAFLRHIERCRVILHLVDATSEDPVKDLAMVNDELKRYGSGSLAEKPQVVIINKIDTAFEDDDDEEGKKKELAQTMKEEMGHTRLMWVSAKEKDGVDELMMRMASYVGKMKEEEEEKQKELEAAEATTVG